MKCDNEQRVGDGFKKIGRCLFENNILSFAYGDLRKPQQDARQNIR